VLWEGRRLPGADFPASLAEDTLGNLGSAPIQRLSAGNQAHPTRTPGDSLRLKGRDGATGLVANPDGSVWVGIASFWRGPGPGITATGARRLEVICHPGVWMAPPWKFDGCSGTAKTLCGSGRQARHLPASLVARWSIFYSADGLSGDMVLRFYEDREGNLWVATSKGIDCFRGRSSRYLSNREGLTTPEVDAVLAAQDGTVWVGGDGALDAIHRDGVLSSLQVGKGLPGNQVTSLLQDHAGRLWVGVDKTMTIYKNGRFSRIDRPDGSPIGLVVGMTEDVDNNIWVETIGPPRTLSRIRDLKVQEAFPVPQMPAAREVAADPEGGIWFRSKEWRSGSISVWQDRDLCLQAPREF